MQHFFSWSYLPCLDILNVVHLDNGPNTNQITSGFIFLYLFPPLYRLGQPFMICSLIVYFASVQEARFVYFSAEAFFFFFRSCILFTRLTSMEFSNFFFKIGSHGTIHTFKNYFLTVFLVFNDKRYPNRPYNYVVLNFKHDPVQTAFKAS